MFGAAVFHLLGSRICNNVTIAEIPRYLSQLFTFSTDGQEHQHAWTQKLTHIWIIGHSFNTFLVDFI